MGGGEGGAVLLFLLELSDRLKKSLDEVLLIPDWQLDLYAAFYRWHDPERRADLRAGEIVAERLRSRGIQVMADEVYPPPPLPETTRAPVDPQAFEKEVQAAMAAWVAVTGGNHAAAVSKSIG